jgi:hypothetical protein
MPSTLKVLSLGTDAELMWLRDAQYAGFDVLTTLDLKEALARIEHRDCGALLLCYSLPVRARKQLAEIFRVNCSNGRIVTITNERSEPEFTEVVVYGVDGPESLIEASARVNQLSNRLGA